MNVGSLFSGIGGIELGFEREGFKTAWFVEQNEFCQRVLKKHWPGIPIYGDITQIDFTQIQKVDILTGGFPCQDISSAGHQKGITGQRSGLWNEYARAIRQIRPTIAVIENVPNLVNLGLDVVLANLAQEGYDAEWFTIRASDLGAPHKRERIFIIAYPISKRFEWRNQKKHRQASHGPKIQGRDPPSAFADAHEIEGQPLLERTTENELGAHANNDRIRPPTSHQQHLQERQPQIKPIFIADDHANQIQRFKQETFSRSGGFSWCQNVRSIKELGERSDIPQPLIRGTRNGIPNRTHRIAALGNAVVPQVAQFIARQIKQGFE